MNLLEIRNVVYTFHQLFCPFQVFWNDLYDIVEVISCIEKTTPVF